LNTHEFIPYGRHTIDQADIDAVTTVLQGDWLTTGPAVDDFEHALERVTGAPTTAVNSGTAALHCAYAAAGLGPETELVTTPMTFVATAAAALHLGATVRFADVSDDTLNLDPQHAEELCGPATRAITAVDFAGHPADLAMLRQVVDRHDALLIEDAAHSLGGSYRGQPVGSIADLTTFSFHPVKTITTAEGGAVASLSQELLEKVQRFRNHGLVREPEKQRYGSEGDWHQEVHRLGLNYRLPDVLAALGRSQLNKLEQFVIRRRELVDRYNELLVEVSGIRLPIRRDDVEPAWHLYPIRILEERRRHVFDYLRSQAIGVQVHYLPVHRHPVFEDLGYANGSCPVAEKAYEELLSLPLHPQITDSQQDRIVEQLSLALQK
jgi:UDP-4-amino-4,6-dideoxy-N-acetyl-beta-L-altrosamine transaminase